MADWTHNICYECWEKQHPDRIPTKAAMVCSEETCCFCGKPNTDGIYVREDPKKLLCKGEHE